MKAISLANSNKDSSYMIKKNKLEVINIDNYHEFKYYFAYNNLSLILLRL